MGREESDVQRLHKQELRVLKTGNIRPTTNAVRRTTKRYDTRAYVAPDRKRAAIVNEPLQAGALLVERKDAPRPHGKTTGKRKLPTALEMVQASRAYTTYVEKEVVAREPGQKLQVNPAMLTAGSFNLPYMNYPNPLATTMMTGVPSVRGDPRPNDKYTLMPT